MGKWTVAHRIGWAIRHLRTGGLPELRRRIARYASPTARAARRRYLAEAASFDAVNGYQTCGTVAIDDLTPGAPGERGHFYVGTAVADVVSALDLLDVPITETTFVDVGCGMARPLLIAAERPFKRLVGIELMQELLTIARRNFALRAQRQGREDDRVELICADATLVPIPDGPVAFFFFNSFGQPTLGRLLRRIHASWRGDPRPIRFISVNIQNVDDLIAEGFRIRTTGPGYRFSIFEPVAPEAAK